jgi:hypothetical protein
MLNKISTFVLKEQGGFVFPIPRYMRDIDKRKLAVIIKLSYFGKFINLPIDKIDIGV